MDLFRRSSCLPVYWNESPPIFRSYPAQLFGSESISFGRTYLAARL
jgi:hypothetical protein